MPETPEEKKRKKGLSDWFDGPATPGQPVQSPINLPQETKVEGTPGYWDSLKRPGYDPTTKTADGGTHYSQTPGADITKIIAQLGSDYIGGGPIGAGVSALTALTNPGSVRPAAGFGNVASMLTGQMSNIPGANKIPGMIKAGAGGFIQGGSDALDQGGNPFVGAGAGLLAGLGLGGIAKRLQGVAKASPSAVAHGIEADAAKLSGPTTNIPSKLTAIEDTFAQFPKVQSTHAEILAATAKQSSLQNFLAAAEKEAKRAKIGLSGASAGRRNATARVIEAKAAIEDDTLRRVAKSQDFLAQDYPNARKDLDEQLVKIAAEKKTKQSGTLGLDSDTTALDAQEATFLGKEVELERRRELSEFMTRAEGKLDARQMQAIGEAKDPSMLAAQKKFEETTETRKIARERYTAARKSIGKTAAEIDAIKTEIDAKQKFIDPFISATGLDPAKMTRESVAALSVAAQNPVTAKGIIHSILYASEGQASELGNPTLAKGLRQSLQNDPHSLSALRSEFLREILDAHQLQTGGVQPGTSKVFVGKAFEDHVNKFDSAAINEFFGDASGPSQTAAAILKGLGRSAAEAEELAKPRMQKIGMSLTMSGGLMFMAGNHLYGGNLGTGLGVLGTAAAVTPIVNYRSNIEKLLKLPDWKGRAVAAFLNSDNVELLPHNVVVEASRLMGWAFGEERKKGSTTPVPQNTTPVR